MSAKVVYIAGYGRSGSTLLERILSANPHIEGLGEVEQLSRMTDLHTSTCGCGEPLGSCPLWGPLISGLEQDFDFGDVRAQQDAADAWEPGRLRAAVGGTRRSANPCTISAAQSVSGQAPAQRAQSENAIYDRFSARVFEDAAARLRQPDIRLIDSSKTARLNALRPFSLVRAGLRVQMIHLVRDGRSAMWSYIDKGSNRLLEQGEEAHVRFAGLRSALSWRLANRAAERFAEAYPEHYLRLRYEDFTAAPRAELERLADFLETDLSREIDALEAEDPFPRVHQVAGNRMRSAETIRLHTDRSWHDTLPARYRALFRVVNGRMARRYGYV